MPYRGRATPVKNPSLREGTLYSLVVLGVRPSTVLLIPLPGLVKHRVVVLDLAEVSDRIAGAHAEPAAGRADLKDPPCPFSHLIRGAAGKQIDIHAAEDRDSLTVSPVNVFHRRYVVLE